MHTPPNSAESTEVASPHLKSLQRILHRAFPSAPHLREACAELFLVSDLNPDPIDDDTRTRALESAATHLREYTELLRQPLSPQDQLIADFRQQLHVS